MPQHLHRGAALMQRRRIEDAPNASWEDLRAFLFCTRHQSFRNAAEVLGMTGTTLMRKIDRLEEELGFKLFIRDQSGLSLSDEGQALLFDVEQMERLSFNIFRRASLSTDTRGSVRVAVTVGTTSWRTSVFPDSKTGAYLLPVKNAARVAEHLAVGDKVRAQLQVAGL